MKISNYKWCLVILTSLCLTSCSYFSAGEISTLVGLTSRLSVENNQSISLVSSHQNIELDYHTNLKSYHLNKGKLITTPAIAKSIVYSLDNKANLSAFSLKTGKFLWSHRFESYSTGVKSGGILYSDGKLYITNGSRNLLVVNAKTGIEILRQEFPDAIRSKPLMVDDKIVVVQTVSNQLIAFNTNTYKIVWINDSEPAVITSKNHSSPLIINNNIFTSYSSGEAVLVNPITGKNKWRLSLENENNFSLQDFYSAVIITKPILYNNHIYFATSNGHVLKVNVSKGRVIWKKSIEDVHSMALSGDNLIITTNARQAAILSLKTGLIKWTGDLINQKEKSKTKVKSTVFQTAFVVHDINNHQSLNIIASNGELYQFQKTLNGKLSKEAVIIPIPKNIQNYWISCCNNKVYLFTDHTAKF